MGFVNGPDEHKAKCADARCLRYPTEASRIHRSHDFQSPAGALLDQPAQIGEAQHGAVLRLKGLVAAIHEIAVLGVYSDERCDVLQVLECARPVGRRRFHFDGILWSAAFFDDEVDFLHVAVAPVRHLWLFAERGVAFDDLHHDGVLVQVAAVLACGELFGRVDAK